LNICPKPIMIVCATLVY